MIFQYKAKIKDNEAYREFGNIFSNRKNNLKLISQEYKGIIESDNEVEAKKLAIRTINRLFPKGCKLISFEVIK